MQFPLCSSACFGAGKISEGTLSVSSPQTDNRVLLPAELAEQVAFSCGEALSLSGTVGTQQSSCNSLSQQDVHKLLITLVMCEEPYWVG